MVRKNKIENKIRYNRVKFNYIFRYSDNNLFEIEWILEIDYS